MRLNVVVRYEGWRTAGEDVFAEAVNLPASVPAYRDLVAAGRRMVTTSSLLTSDDYQDVWRRSFLAVWDTVRPVLEGPSRAGPDPRIVHAYSLYLLLGEILILDRFLEACARRDGVTELGVEKAPPEDGTPYLFYEGLYTSYFPDVARAWAAHRGIPVIEAARAVQGTGRDAEEAALPASAAAGHVLRAALRRVLRSAGAMAADGMTRVRNVLARARGGKHVVFYLPDRLSGLSHNAPGYAVNVAPLMRRLTARPAPGSAVAPLPAALIEPVLAQAPAYRGLILDRFRRHLSRNHAAGTAVFQGFAARIGALRRAGSFPACVFTTPFLDWNLTGYAAEAFRGAGLPVAAVQHGGNARLVRRAATPTLLSDYMGGVFYQWGKAASDEHVAYGARFPVRFVRAGSPRMGELRRARRSRRRDAGKPRLLYAPTAVNVSTTLGNNVVWDAYIPLLREVCAILEDAPFETTVKALNSPEAGFIGFSDFPKLRVITRGGFTDLMPGADYLLVDSLGGSPVYEALATDKPLLVYTGTEHQAWDEEFLAALRRRAVCFGDGDGYLRGLRDFAADPEGFLARSEADPSSDAMDGYYPSTTPAALWTTIRETIFMPPPAAEGRP